MPSFRYATADDTAVLRALIESAYRGPRAAETRFSEANLLTGPRTSDAEIAALIASPTCRFLVTEIADRLAGCVLIKQADPGEAYLGMFAIDPELQSGGLGKALMVEAERAVGELWDARVMVMTVISLRDDLIGWYGRRGYALTGRREPFPFHEAAGAVRTDFDFVELRKEL